MNATYRLAIPRLRMLVLEASVEIDSLSNLTKTRARIHPIVALETIALPTGPEYSPLIVVDGEIVSLIHARAHIWQPSTVDQIVVCTWQPHLDRCMTRKIRRRLKAEAKTRDMEIKTGKQLVSSRIKAPITTDEENVN